MIRNNNCASKQLLGLWTVNYSRNIIFAGMRSIKSLLVLFILILNAASVFAQSNNATLYGKITDQTGKPLELANISIRNSSIGTVSNRNGEYLFALIALPRASLIRNRDILVSGFMLSLASIFIVLLLKPISSTIVFLYLYRTE